jgi:CHAT domain
MLNELVTPCQHPSVFMNSCTSGGAVPLYTDMAGWAEKFLEAGCGALIGSLWEIRDASPLTFAEHFYDEFTGGKNLGESIRAARSVLKRSDPIYLAYTLYGNPLAKIFINTKPVLVVHGIANNDRTKFEQRVSTLQNAIHAHLPEVQLIPVFWGPGRRLKGYPRLPSAA